MTAITSKVYLGLFAEPSDIIDNGGFETAGGGGGDIFEDWTEFSAGLGITDEGVIVHAGSHACKFTNTDSNGPQIDQVIVVGEDHKMDLSFWSRGDGANPGQYEVYDNTNGTELLSGNTTLDTTYTLTEEEFTTPAGCVSLRITFWSGSTIDNIFYVDDVSIFDYGGVDWVLNEDVMAKPYPTWDYGIQGTGPTDLVADTGIATFNLDNSGGISKAAHTVYFSINGDFEDLDAADDFSLWTEFEIGTGTVTDELVEIHGGTHACKIDGDFAGISLSVAILVGTEYTLTCWVKGDWGLKIDDGSPWASSDSGNVAAWTEKSISLVPLVSPVTLFIAPWDLSGAPGAGTGYFDDATFSYFKEAVTPTPGLYSPDHDNVIFGFEEGMPIKIETKETYDTGVEVDLDSGFETLAGANDWTEWTETPNAGTITDELVTIHSGAHAVKMISAAAGIEPVIEYNNSGDYFDLVVGETYTASAWVKGTGTYYLEFGTWGKYISVTGTLTATWTKVNLGTLVADNDVGYVWGGPDSVSTTMYLDDFTVQRLSNTKTKFVGTVNTLRPTASLFDDPVTEVEAHDWMGYASKQELGIHPVENTKTADEGLTTALVEFPNQPEDTDFDVGVEEFLLMFNTDDSTESMARFFQKMARNEMGRIYSEGDGTLVFENRDSRALTTVSSFTIDGTMTDFDISYNSGKIYNIISMLIKPTVVDAAATTTLWDVGDEGLAIKAGQTLTLRCSYTDPNTREHINAFDVVNPIDTAEYEFGTLQESGSDNLHALLTQNNTVGGSSISCILKNTHSSATGYLNQFSVKGKGIYVYNNITLEASDSDSIDQVGERKFFERLDQIVDPGTAYNYAAFIKGNYAPSHIDTCKIRVLANQTDALAKGLIEAEVSTRFTVIEDVTGISRDFYVQKIQYKQEDTLLWVTIYGISSNVASAFIWNSSHWSSEDDARWQL